MNDFFPIGARVRLRDNIDPNLYKGLSRTGQEGWIRQHRRDKYGYSQVLVEWDRSHWADNQQPDCWTWQDHFDLVERDMADKKPKPHQQQSRAEERARELTAGFVKALFQTMGLTEQETEIADEETQTTEVVEGTPDEILDEATKALKTGKAFIVITMQQDDSGGLIHPACYQQADSEELALVCQAQLGHLVAMLQDGLIHGKLQEKQQEG